MKCPHCNQEHPDGYPFCPNTGKKIEYIQFKACTNSNCIDFGKYMLPSDSLFCPTCGHKLNASSNRDKCDELHKFFPIADIILGETTFSELNSKHQYERLSCSYSDANGKECSYYDKAGWVLGNYCGMWFYTEYGIDTITRISFDVRDDDFKVYDNYQQFSRWHELGFDWDLSYMEWKNLFMGMGYYIEEEGPRKRYLWEDDDIGNQLVLFIASAPDHSIQFELVFSYGEHGCQLQSKKTLYSIKVTSKHPEGCLDDSDDVITDAEFVPVNNNSALTCPHCGSSNVTDDGGSYLQYECKNCGHVWGDKNAIDELHKFFPIAGITLGETTLAEAEKNKNKYLYDIDYQFYDEDGLVFIGCGKISFVVSDTDNSISNAYMRSEEMPLKWHEHGFDRNLSYEEWISLFESMCYEIKVQEEPHFIYGEFGRSWKAVFDAYSPDRSIHFQMIFEIFNCKSVYQLLQQKGTLDKIEVYSF